MFVWALRQDELAFHLALMPREILYSRIMEHDLQQNTSLVQLHLIHNGNHLVAQGVHLLPLALGLQVLEQPPVRPSPWRRSVCVSVRGLSVFSLPKMKQQGFISSKFLSPSP